MKKVYTKPEIMFESFTLSQAIAGDCTVKTSTPSEGNCAYGYKDEFFGDVVLFTNDMNACEFQQPDGYNGICYDVPTASNLLFNS